MKLRAFCRLLAESPVSRLMQDHAWLVPAIQTVHLVCLAVVFPAMLFVSLRLCGVAGRARTVAATGRALLPAALLGLIGLLASGVLLIVAEPSRELPNPAFQAKMAMLLVVLALTLIQARAWRRPGADAPTAAQSPLPLVLRLSGLVSMLLWTAILVAGRWIAYLVEN